MNCQLKGSHKHTSIEAHTLSHCGVLLGRRLSTSVPLIDLTAWRRPAHTLNPAEGEVEAGTESGLEKEISPLKCLPWRQFAELALPCLLHCLRNSTQSDFLGGLNGLRSACAAGSHQVNEMISSAHLKWTKSSTRWTPAPFSWFWLFRSTPMASRGQQVRHTFISISWTRLGSFTIRMKVHWKKKQSESGGGANFCAPVPPKHAAAFICAFLPLSTTYRGTLSSQQRLRAITFINWSFKFSRLIKGRKKRLVVRMTAYGCSGSEGKSSHFPKQHSPFALRRFCFLLSPRLKAPGSLNGVCDSKLDITSFKATAFLLKNEK